MNYKMTARLLGMVMLIVALMLIPPFFIAVIRKENGALIGFAITMGAMALIGWLLTSLKPRRMALYAREGFILVALTWIVVSLFGALPFYISGEIPSYVDCLFETISGFTTTGASILGDVEALSMSLLYWRSFTHWLGGMGVLVFLLAIAPLATGNGDTLYIMRAESPGPSVNKLVPKTRQSARILYGIYIGMTVAQTIMLLAGGMSFFDSITTAFGTAGTGGFAIYNDSLASCSPYIQWVVTVFMALFGVNFGVYYLIIIRKFRKAAKNEEVRFYFLVIIAAIAVSTLSTLASYGGNLETALRHSAFQVVSIITTTGFSTADFNLWPQLVRSLLVLLMIIGACAGSTGGGVKCSRILILVKSLKREIRLLLHPNTVSTIRIDGEPVQNATVTSVFAFFGAYALISFASTLLISLDGFSFETNLTAVIACINNIGPGLGSVGPMSNYGGFSDISKLVLSVNMLIGRLEIFPMLMLFMPSVWKRARG
ncbi:MAG: TrkH family potassium uptake protein [Eubacteriales bacterium]|nr:TrkH family potassium uptake protein [Eubacteriales bacterium]MDD3883061.1 TrkH family potassium uptake protein [Eubacteriales bacterium]MDD4513612.1 TrkH family potassium uptake protein [Eubacteriales bacterium]